MKSNTTTSAVCSYHSPLGSLRLVAEQGALKAIHFADPENIDSKQSDHPLLANTVLQLGEYFDGKRQSFDLPLNPEGSEFQQEVWKALSEIPFGHTLTYLELAKKLGNPNSVRAVGRANGQNPIPIIIPCHRIIGAEGKLVGYSGGLENKKWLLRHEGVLLL